jgi:hypothetical protein
MRRVLAAFAIVIGLGLVLTPVDADATGRGGHAPSVFPRPHDPWRSWGVHRELPHRLPPPHVHRGAGRGVIIVTPAPAPVWVPGQWWWDGAGWRWAPGYWAY